MTSGVVIILLNLYSGFTGYIISTTEIDPSECSPENKKQEMFLHETRDVQQQKLVFHQS